VVGRKASRAFARPVRVRDPDPHTYTRNLEGADLTSTRDLPKIQARPSQDPVTKVLSLLVLFIPGRIDED